MTAEIAIMNRSAIALAADSAVTINAKNNVKIYNTVNKLFTISKYHPIGVMIYGSADLMGIPWETIIKIYRNKLQEKRFSTLEEYAQDFMNFLDDENELFPEYIQDNYVKSIIVRYFGMIQGEIDEEVREITNNKGNISENEIKKITSDTIQKHCNIWGNSDLLPHLPEDYISDIMDRYNDFIEEKISEVFQKLPINAGNNKKLKLICSDLFSKDRFLSNFSEAYLLMP